jgi:PAS domain S-box-containing protein
MNSVEFDMHHTTRAMPASDAGFRSLEGMLGGPMEVGTFLCIAIAIASALGRVHQQGLVHKDIKPGNILVNSDSGEVRFAAFSLSPRTARERPQPRPPETIAGTLAYMAPEQTGWMNRSIDARSDLYAFGVTLYQMLTGCLPFTASDPMEWVHCHIARKPVPPSERLENVPAPVSAIIMRLLVKTPEDRYQTAGGVGHDLRRCLAAWEAERRIDDFPLGEHDMPDRLLVPEKLYGRSREVETLLTAFDRMVTSGKPELVLVSGYSGIGKSSVVNELQKVLVPARGLFASGKFDQYKLDIPYATLAEAFQKLIQSLLGKSEAELARWRDALREALDSNGQLMVDLVPRLKLIIGEQPPVPELSPQDAQRRFQFVLRRFLGVFTRPEHPLVLFLDDLQWLDTATLDLLEDLLTRSELRHLMLIGAYRNNEVMAAHPLTRRLKAIRDAEVHVEEVSLAPLSREDVGQLVADALRCEPARAGPLTELVHEKTGGNPFFVIQFLCALADEGLLAFDYQAARWSWDLGRIHEKAYTANVVDLMVGKLSRLRATTQEGLQQLACLGNGADLATLALVRGASEEEVHADLWEAVRLDLVERLDGTYRFVHDRVQEAAYSLIPEPSRAVAHLRIGRVLAAHTAPEKREEVIFEIVNQLNRGVALITSRNEREQLAEFNLIAGKRAENATAYTSALTYLAAGRALLPEDCWDRCSALTFALEFHRARCEFPTGAYAGAEERLLLLSRRAGRLVDLAAVTSLQVELFTTLGRSDRAVEACLAYLRHMDVQWSARPTEEEVRQEYERIWRQIGNRSIEELVDLPLMADPEWRATMDVLTAVLPPALFTDEKLLCLVICRMANLSLEHGNSDAACVAYVSLGMLLGPRFGNYRAGFSFGKLGLDLVDLRGLRRFESRVCVMFGGRVSPWTQPVRTGLSLVWRAFDAASRLGDLTYAGLTRNVLLINLLFTGDPLGDVQREAEVGLAFARQFGFGHIIDYMTVNLGLIRTLRGQNPEFGSFNGTEFDEGQFERRLAEDPAMSTAARWYWICQLQARFFAGAYVQALAAASNVRSPLSTPGSLEVAEYHVYAALVRAALCDTASVAERTQHQEALAAHHRQLQEWAENCPANFEGHVGLIGAEIARIEGRALDAERLYEQAIRSARTNDFVHNEAVANELAARFYAARGFETTSRAYLREARCCYLRWGADGKVRQLDERFPRLREEVPALDRCATIGDPVERLELATVLKVLQAASGEIVLERLVETLLRTAIEQAGAERGLLILSHGSELSIQAEAQTRGSSVTVRLRETPVSMHELPESLVRYVARTQENVILDDASVRNPFSNDEYIHEQRPRSVLCLPLVKQGVLVALLYMENNLGPNFFAPNRIAVLKVLAHQAAISLDNSRLYRELQEREGRIRRLVDANVIGVLISDSNGEIVESNDAYLKMVGYTREELVSGRMRWRDMTPSQWKVASEYGVAQVEATGACKVFEKEYYRKDGSRVPVLVGAARFEKSSTVAFAVDLTELKRAEQTLRRSQHYLAEAQKASHTGSWAWSPVSNTILYWSEECYRISGYDPAQGLPSLESSFQRIHPEDQLVLAQAIERAVRDKAEFQAEYRHVMPDGTQRNVRVLSHPVLDASGQLVEFIGTVMDVTEQKRAEEERREHLWFLESMDRINRAMQRTNNVELMMSGVVKEALAIFGCDRAWLVYPCDPDSPAVRAVMEHTSPGYPGAFALGEELPVDTQAAQDLRRVLQGPGAVIDLIVSPEIRERFSIESMIAIAVRPKGDRPYLFGLHQCSHPRTWTAAERRLFEEIARRLEDALTSVLAHRNLLASQEALQVLSGDLQESKAKLEEAQRIAHVGYWEWDISTDRVNWSDETYRIYGLQPQERPMDLAAVREKIHPEDWQRALEAALGGAPFDVECRAFRPTGEVRIVVFQGDARRDASGKPYRMFGTVQDITDRKRAEEERREHLWFLESMDRINRAMQRTNDVEGMMSGVLEETLAIFGCDRAWLIYPCDPDSPTVRAVMEHTSPEYPGAFALGEELPVDGVGSEVLRSVLLAPGAVENPVMPPAISERFGIQSMIAIAVRPKGDRPYLFGLTQCSRPRAWTADERRLFEETARRLEDVLTSVLAHRNLLASQEELRTSEGRFRTFVDHATDAFFLYDDEDIVRDVNRQACETTGYTREELIGMHPRQFNLGLTPEKVEWIRGQLREHGNVTFTGLRRRKDGTHFPVEVRARTFERGGRVFSIALATDITERRRREQCLLAQHGVTRALSQSASLEDARQRILCAIGEALGCDFGVLWCLDLQAGVLRCADAWSPASAARPAFEAAMRAASFEPGMDLPGRVWSTGTSECIRDLAADPSSARTRLVANEGLHAAFAFPIAPRSGHAGVIEFLSREVHDADPELLQAMTTVGSQIDQFVERTRAEDALRATRSELVHVTRVMSMGELTASIAHEVNQPLGAMVTSAASASRWLAANPPNLEKAWLALARIAADGERASAIIDRTRRLVKRQDPGREPIDVNETIRSVVALMRDELERAGVTLAVRPADNLPPVLGDRVLLQQVIVNLILNAIDAMRGIEDRARVLRIEPRLDDGGEVRVQVRDTGIGLPPDARLFDAFYTTKQGGLGMGLSISRSIVEALGGRMHARPNEPHGAIFEFSLPVTQP